MGEYISALSNSAAIAGKKFAYFVRGVNDKSHINWINVMGDKVGGKGSDKAGDKNTESLLNHTQARILAEIRNNPNNTKPHFAETLKLGKTTIDKGIAVLKKSQFVLLLPGEMYV